MLACAIAAAPAFELDAPMMPMTASVRASSDTPRSARSGSVAVSRTTSCVGAGPPAAGATAIAAPVGAPVASIAARNAASPTT